MKTLPSVKGVPPKASSREETFLSPQKHGNSLDPGMDQTHMDIELTIQDLRVVPEAQQDMNLNALNSVMETL